MTTMANRYEDLTLSEEFTWDPNQHYTPRELDFFADLILRADVRAGNKIRGTENPILFAEHIRTRHKREIYNHQGVPDPSIQQGMYHRTHPEGRKVNTEEQRKRNGASYYK